jgi:hypothetical protein
MLNHKALTNLMLLVKKHQQRRLMVVALFIATLMKTVFRLSISTTNSEKKTTACASCGSFHYEISEDQKREKQY